MKRVFCVSIVIAFIFFRAGIANAADYLIINQNVTGGANIDQVKLTDSESEFYMLRVVSNGK